LAGNPPDSSNGFQASLLIELEKLDGGSILDNKSYGYARGGRVGRDEYLFSGDLCREVVHFEGDMRNRTHEFRDPRFSFEAHPLDSVGARFISRHERRIAFDQAFTFPAFGRGNSDVVIPPRGING